MPPRGQSGPFRTLIRLTGSPLLRQYSCGRTVQEYDVLFLRQHGAKHAKWHLTAPLRPGSRVKLSYGTSLSASDLIGRHLLSTVLDDSGHPIVLHEPTLASYIVNSERYATPIYPHDATTIVSLLDLHPSPPGEESSDENLPPLEIFEAGTGMGSLTLHISRAIHAANPPLPRNLRALLLSSRFKPHYDFSSSRACLDISPDDQSSLDNHAASRRFILHTLDRNPKHARAAYRLVRNFRRAQYLPNIDFHVGEIDSHLRSRLDASHGEPYLHRAVLDLPAAHEHAALVVAALRPNALLLLFNPSISQIAQFQAWAADSAQPLRLEKVIELLPTTVSDAAFHDSSGGRQWDVKTVVPRADEHGKSVQVMRPKVGDRVAGGGFVAVFRRWPSESSTTMTQQP